MNTNSPYLVTVKQEEGLFVASAVWWRWDGWHELQAEFPTLTEALEWLKGETQ